MRRDYCEDVDTLAIQYPFCLILWSLDDPVVLIPSVLAKSDYDGVRITDVDRIRQLLGMAATDQGVMARVRRMASAIMAGADLPRLPDHAVLDATARAVASGRLYAIVAEENKLEKGGTDHAINYRALFTNAFDQGRFDSLTTQDLPQLWCDAYRRMTDAQMELVQVSDEGYQFIFDVRAERVVVAFGTARYNPARRDADRMKDFLGSVTSNRNLQRIRDAAPSAEVAGQRQDMAQLTWRERFFRTYGHLYDRGHFMSHRQGGGLDINLFPQRADINQGRGPLGVAYRSMEKECVAHPGVFCFSRPIYEDDTWVPVKLDYGLSHGPRQISVQSFPNR